MYLRVFLRLQDKIDKFLAMSEEAVNSAVVRAKLDMAKLNDCVQQLENGLPYYIAHLKETDQGEQLSADEQSQKNNIEKTEEQLIKKIEAIKENLHSATHQPLVAHFSDKHYIVDNTDEAICASIQELTGKNPDTLSNNTFGIKVATTSPSFAQDKARITCNTFQSGNNTQSVVSVQRKQSGDYVTQFHFLDNNIQAPNTSKWFQKLPNDNLLRWADIQLKEYKEYMALNKKDLNNETMYIRGTSYPNKDYVAALMLICKLNKVDCVNMTGMKVDVSASMLKSLEEKVKKQPELFVTTEENTIQKNQAEILEHTLVSRRM